MPASETEMMDTIRAVADQLGHVPSRSEFLAQTGLTEYQVLKYFSSWSEAQRIAGLKPNSTNVRLDDKVLFEDWAALALELRGIPTRHQYRQRGRFSPEVFAKHFGPWSRVPAKFREFADGKPEWAEVIALLPVPFLPKQTQVPRVITPHVAGTSKTDVAIYKRTHNKLNGASTYGNPMDFRGLRHEPVNEQGVVFLFGMVARELGYMVEGVQAGYPDCDAKRQIGPDKWQRVRIEFEFESRNFRDHGHPIDGCDVIICWRHNWDDCPLEILELKSEIKVLSKSPEI